MSNLNIKSVLEMTEEEIESYRKLLGVVVSDSEPKLAPNIIKTYTKGKGLKKREYYVFNCERCGKIDSARKWTFLSVKNHWCKKCKKYLPRYFVKKGEKKKCVDKTIK